MDAQTANPLQTGQPEIASIDAARGLLRGAGDTPAPASAPPREAEPAPQNSAPEADPAPVEEQASEAPEQTEPADEPPLEAPRSWNRDHREKWSSLPRDIQQYLLDRDHQVTSDLNRKQSEADEARKKWETASTGVEAERARYKQQLDSIIPVLQQSLVDDFADIRTPADEIALAQRDPARYTVFQAKRNALQAAWAQQHQVQQEQASKANDSRRQLVEKEVKSLLEKKPELKDRKKQQEFVSAVRDYALDFGYPAEAFDNSVSHLNLLVLEKAMLYDKAQAEAKKALVKQVPKVQVPGSARDKSSRAADQRASLMKRAEQTGDLRDFARLLRT